MDRNIVAGKKHSSRCSTTKKSGCHVSTSRPMQGKNYYRFFSFRVAIQAQISCLSQATARLLIRIGCENKHQNMGFAY